MTVAPTAGIAYPTFDAVSRTRISCTACGTAANAHEPFCAHCGARVVLAARSGPASVAATRSLQFAVLVVATNILVGGMSFGVVYLLSDAARLTEAAFGLEAMRLLIIGALVAVAIRYGVRGIRETRDGTLRRRTWAVAGVIVASGFGLLVTLSFLATTLLFVVSR